MGEILYNMFYIYAYIRNKDSATAKAGTPYYIGKGHGDRAYQKRKHVPKPKSKNCIVILENNLSEIGAFALERRYIKWWGRKDLGNGILLNRTDGGEGSTGEHPWQRGRRHSDDTKRKMSEFRKSKPLTKAQIEVLKSMAEGNKGAKPWNSGKKLGSRTEEQIQNNRESQLERWKIQKEKRDSEYLKNPSYCCFCNTPLSFRKRNYKFCGRQCTGNSKKHENKTRN